MKEKSNQKSFFLIWDVKGISCNMTGNEAERSVVEPDLIRSSFTHNKWFCLALPRCWHCQVLILIWLLLTDRTVVTLFYHRLNRNNSRNNFRCSRKFHLCRITETHVQWIIVIFSCDTKIQYLDIFSRLHVMDSVEMFSQTFFCVIDVLVLPREWGNRVWLFFVF